jgi:hypothetical protein
MKWRVDMRLRTDPYRVDLSELAIVAGFRLEERFWRFREVFEDVERAFRQNPFSYNMLRLQALPARELFVALTAAIPGCPRLRWLIEIEGEIVRIWAISPPTEPSLDAEIVALFDQNGV